MALFDTGLVSMDTCLEILNITKEASPAIVLGLFLVVFIIHGILTAPNDVDKVQIHAMKGPGGRPLPQRRVSANRVTENVNVKDFSPRAKLVFRLLQLVVLVTFILNAIAIILQTLIYRKDEWWPGESAVVCLYFSKLTT